MTEPKKVDKYSLFNGYECGGGISSYRDCEEGEFSNCTSDRLCQFVGAASFDTNGEILIPSSDPRFWSNTALPSAIHPISCCYTVNIEGISNYSEEESFYQDADFLNIDFVSLYNPSQWNYFYYNFGNHHGSCEEDRWSSVVAPALFFYELCDESYPITHGYKNIKGTIHVGPSGNTKLSMDEIYPSGCVDPNGNTYIYKHEWREQENRPKLYVFLATSFSINSTTDVLRGLERTDCNCSPTIHFKTIIDEYRGDYVCSLFPEYPYYSECQSVKPYHGDLDLRNVNITVTGNDLWPYREHPGDFWSSIPFTSGVDVLYNFDNMRISINGDTINKNDIHFSNKIRRPFYAQKNAGYYDSNGEQSIYGYGYESGIPGYGMFYNSPYDNNLPKGYGPLSTSLWVKLDDVRPNYEFHPESGFKHSCFEVDKLNDWFKLELIRQTPNVNDDFFDWGEFNTRWYYGEIDPICCQCIDETYWYSQVPTSGCIRSICAKLNAKGLERTRAGKKEYSTTLELWFGTNNIESYCGNSSYDYISQSGNPYYGIYEYMIFGNWGEDNKEPFITDFVGDYYWSIYPQYNTYGSIYDLSQVVMTVRFPSVYSVPCGSKIAEHCGYFTGNEDLDNIIVTIPNGWTADAIRYPHACLNGTFCFFEKFYVCPNNDRTLCNMYYNGIDDCILSYLLCTGTDRYIPTDYSYPHELCDMPNGEYILSRSSLRCRWEYVDPDETMVGSYYCMGRCMNLDIYPLYQETLFLPDKYRFVVKFRIYTCLPDPGRQVIYFKKIIDSAGSKINKCRPYVALSQLNGLELDFDYQIRSNLFKWNGDSVTLSLI